jgi:hypothetical protein
MSDEYTQEEYDELMREQAGLQGIDVEGMSRSEMIEYLETLAEDKAFKIDDKGDIVGGTVPYENKLTYWATNSKNTKWGNIGKDIIRKIRLSNLQISMAEKMYTINPKLAREDSDIGKWALREKNSLINNINQRIQTEINLSRGKDGFERRQVGTATGQFVSETPQKQNQSTLGKLLGGITGR